MDLNSFADFILHHDIIGFHEKPLTLKSGRESHFYVNWRKASNDAYLLDQLTDAIVSFIEQKKITCDTLYGVPEGASKTAVIAAFKLAKRQKDYGEGSRVIAMGRAKPKLHGDPRDKFFIGAPVGETVVLEDTITTGLSLFQCLDQLREAGVKVTAVIALTDRGEMREDGKTEREYLSDRYDGQIAYYPMSVASDLLKKAVRRARPSAHLVEILAKELSMRPSELRGEG